MTLFEEIKRETCQICAKECTSPCLQQMSIEDILNDYKKLLKRRAGNDENSICYQTLQEILKEVI